MKAIVCSQYGSIDDLEYCEVPDPVAGPDDVIIRSKSIGVNFPDTLLVQGLYQAKPPLPFTPGMEVVGDVFAIGENVRGFKPGDLVAAISQIGAWSELVKCHSRSVMKLPDEANADEVVALLCGYGTSHHGLKQRAQLKPGETLAITGASGLTGLAAVQIGKAMGAKVIAIASNAEKQELAKENGADICLGYENLKDALKNATNGNGVDVVFDVVGGDTFDACARAMAWQGRLLVVGFASGTIPKFPINLALVKGFSVVGVFWGNFTSKQPDQYASNIAELMRWYEEGSISPHIDASFKLENVADALAHILERKAVGKIVLKL